MVPNYIEIYPVSNMGAKVNNSDSTLFSSDNYLELISDFISSGYGIKKFSPSTWEQDTPTLIIRHDIDISPDLALRLARIEATHGIYSSYSFMLRSPFYNILSPASVLVLNEINNLGHDIFLHIDPFLYLNIDIGLMQEIEILRKYYSYLNDKVYSLHRPGALVDSEYNSESIINLQNVSSNILFGSWFDYVSDSMGEWRNGYPTKTNSFTKRNNIQLLTHPIWWIQDGSTPAQKLKTYLGKINSSQKELIRYFLPKFYEKNVTEITLSEF
jgi:hypothetical protein